MEKSPLNLKGSALTYENFSVWAKIGIPKNESLLFEYSLFVKTPKSFSQRSTIFMFRSTYIFPRCVRSVFLVSFQMNKILVNHRSVLWNPTKMLTFFFLPNPHGVLTTSRWIWFPLTDYNCSYRCFVDCQFVDSLLKKEYGALWPPPSLWMLIFPCQLTIQE